MMGTLASFLAKKDILTTAEYYQAQVEGDIEDVNGVLKITRIRVHYDLKIPPGRAAEAREAFDGYLPSCPGAQSVIGCIRIEHDIEIKETRS